MAAPKEDLDQFSWPEYLQTKIIPAVNSNKTSLRTEFFSDDFPNSLKAFPLPEKAVPLLVKTLLPTIHRYKDRSSRLSILKSLGEIGQLHSNAFSESILALVGPEVDKLIPSSITSIEAVKQSPSLRFNYLLWINLALDFKLSFLSHSDSQSRLDKSASRLVELQSKLFWSLCLVNPSKLSSSNAKSVFRSSQSDVRRLLRKHYCFIPQFMAALTSGTLAKATYVPVMLGNVISTSTRLRNSDEVVKSVDESKAKIIECVQECLLSSKSLVPYSAVADLGEFISKNIDYETFEKQFLPVIKKMFLRQPENVTHVLIWLLDFLPFDHSKLFSIYFAETLAQLLIKSSSKAIQEKAAALFSKMSEKCADANALVSSSKTVVTILGKNKTISNETRVLLLGLLKSSVKGSSDKSQSSAAICDIILDSFAKETQEFTKVLLLESLGVHFSVIISSETTEQYSEVIEKVLAAAKQGINQPGQMLAVRKAWIISVIADSLLSSTNLDLTCSLNPLVIKLVLDLVPLYKKFASNQIGSGLDVTEGYAIVSALCSIFDCIPLSAQRLLSDQVLSSASDSSPFFVDRSYHKITNTNDANWVINTLISVYSAANYILRLEALDFPDFEICSYFIRPLVWVFLNQNFKSLQKGLLKKVRTIAGLNCALLTTSSVSVLLSIMNDHAASLKNDVKGEDNVPTIDTYAWFKFVASMVPTISDKNSKEEVSRLIVDLALVAHHPLFLNKDSDIYNWLYLFQISGLDAGEICRIHIHKLSNMVLDTFLEYSIDDPQGLAAQNLVQSLSFVLGGDFIEQALELSEQLVVKSQIGAISSEAKTIWNTPESELAFDPLAEKIAKSPRNIGGDKWDEKVKAEVMTKRLMSNKLTKDEQATVDKQKAYELSVRKSVQSSYDFLSAALSIISNAVLGNIESSRRQAAKIIEAITNGILKLKNTDWLLGSFAGARLIEICSMATGVNPSLHAPVAIALLRTNDLVDSCPSEWLVEPIETIVSRLLFSFQIASDSASFEPADFAIIFPILAATIEHGGWGEKSSTDKSQINESDEYLVMDQPTEQIALVAALLTGNAPKAASNMFPRAAFLKSTLVLMKKFTMFLGKGREAFLSATNAFEELEGLTTERHIALAGLLESDTMIRNTCLESLANFDFNDAYSESEDIDAKALMSHDLLMDLAVLWITACDNDTSISELALELWKDFDLSTSVGLIKLLVSGDSGFLSHKVLSVRQSTANAISAAIVDISSSELQSNNKISENDISELILSEESIQSAAYAIEQLLLRYKEWYINLEPEYDNYGIVIPSTTNRVDPSEARVAVSWSIKNISPLIPSETHFEPTISFLLDSEAFGDRNDEVREAILEAGLKLVQDHGNKHTQYLNDLFDVWLAKPDQNTDKYDHMREAVIVLLGSLASHLEIGDPRIVSAVNNLASSLHTPSESVQSAVSTCLVGLSKKLESDELEKLISSLFTELLTGKKYAIRRGAAYGLAGIVKGSGLSILRKYNIVDKLKEAAGDRKNVNARQGSLFALETFSKSLGRIFEPYMIQILPVMLNLFGDSNADVREATAETTKVIMSQLSGYGVKLVLPSLLSGLQNNQWRTKKGSIEMLGAMAFCAPTQLKAALPTVVPHLVELMADTHVQVSESAYQALATFGSVINNPEIIDLVPTLLEALKDPANKTNMALTKLLETAFVHYIDAPSLALIAPVLERGMKERKTTTKRNASQVFGSMALLSEPAVLVIYLPKMVPLLKSILSDPVPETRGTAAKALGKLVSRLGEERFESLVEELLGVLRSNANLVDSAGTAQALSEVLNGIGLERLDSLMPEILEGVRSDASHIRNGYMLLFLYLPSTFGDSFVPYLSTVLTPTLYGLADDNEEVRKTSLRVGQTLVMFYATKASHELVNGLIFGLKDMNWRIRKASVELLGDLLLRIAGKTGNMGLGQSGEDDEFAEDVGDGDSDSDSDGDEGLEEASLTVESIKKALGEALGESRRDFVIASLYILRNDEVIPVRQASLSVWKTITSNTPRTVKEVLEPLVEIVLEGLSSEHDELRSTAAHTLGDMVRKLGNTVIERVIPILEKNLHNADLSKNSRQGIFIGLSEILSSSSNTHLEDYAAAITPLVRVGLCDSDSMVRESAAVAFDSLQSVMGPRILEDVVPFLLKRLNSTPTDDDEKSGIAVSADAALKALEELMSIRANLILPTLIPTLIVKPVSAFNAKALESLILTAGTSTPTLFRRLSDIYSALFDSAYVHSQNDDAEAKLACRQTIMSLSNGAAKNENTLELVMGLVFDAIRGSEVLKDVKARESDSRRFRRVEGCYAIAAVFQSATPGSATFIGSGIGKYTPELLPVLVGLLGSSDEESYTAAHAALISVCKSIPKPEVARYVSVSSKAVKSAAKNLSQGLQTIPGFNMKNGIAPLLSIYTHSLLEGPPATKELAVQAMSDLVLYTEQEYLKSHVTSITGPLIRIVGDRIPPEVRSSVISNLKILLVRSPQFLRPFLPQLQRTFVKFLLESDASTRTQSQEALSVLILLLPRLDPLVSELTSGIRNMITTISSTSPSADDSIYDSCAAMIKSLKSVLESPNSKTLTESSRKSIEQCLVGSGVILIGDRRVQSAAADTLPVFLRSMPATSGSAEIESVVGLAIAKPGDNSDDIESKMRIIISLLQRAPAILLGSEPMISPECLISSIIVALSSKELNAVLLGISAATLITQQELFYVSSTQQLGLDLQTGPSFNSKSLSQSLISELYEYINPENSNAEFIDNEIKQSVFLAYKDISKSPLKKCQDTIINSPLYHKIISVAFSYVRSRVIPLKLAAEQCILYALHLAKTPNYSPAQNTSSVNTAKLNKYIEDMGGASSELGKLASDYYRRVLSKLAANTFEEDYASDADNDDSSNEN